MLHGFRCPRPPCVECILELWHSPELMAHHLSGRLGERTQLQPISWKNHSTCQGVCFAIQIATLRPRRYTIRRKPQGLHPRNATTALVVSRVASNVEKRLSPSRCLLCQQRCRGNLYDGFRCPWHLCQLQARRSLSMWFIQTSPPERSRGLAGAHRGNRSFGGQWKLGRGRTKQNLPVSS